MATRPFGRVTAVAFNCMPPPSLGHIQRTVEQPRVDYGEPKRFPSIRLSPRRRHAPVWERFPSV